MSEVATFAREPLLRPACKLERGSELVLSIHVPKTAGTTVGYILDYGYGRRVLWDYTDDYSNATQLDALTARHLEFIESWFRVIHGHFFYRKYAEVFPSARYIVTLRHPVSRIKSQFLHLAHDPHVGDWRQELIIKGKMDVVEFARSDPNVTRAYAAHIEGRQIDDFDFVFISENVPLCLELFHREFNFKRKDPLVGQGVPQLNMGEKRRALDHNDRIARVTHDQEIELFNLIPEDVEIYRRAQAKLCKLRAKYGC